MGKKQFEEESAYLMIACESITEGSHGRNVEAETEEDAMEECPLRSCFSSLLSLMSYTTQNHQASGGWVGEWLYGSELRPPPTSTIKNTYHRLIHKPIWWGHLLS